MGTYHYILECEKVNKELKKDIEYYKRQNRRLKEKVNQLETNRDEAIELLSKGVTFCENDSQGLYDKCNIIINREKKSIEMLKRGKEC